MESSLPTQYLKNARFYRMDNIWFIAMSVGIGILSGLIVRVSTKSKYETNFQKNTKAVYNEIFACISRVDSYKQRIYEMLESGDSYKNSKTLKIFNLLVYKEIQHFRNLILNEVKQITFYKNSPYVLLSEYLLLLQYCWSAYDYLYKIRDKNNVMGLTEKSLRYHIFYAKEITTTFKNAVPEDFSDKWELEFEKLGGLTRITKPLIKPGDIITSHYNFQNELMYSDAQYSSIMELLREINQAKSMD